MLAQDLIKKVRRIEIRSHRRVSSAMSGQYQSHFKGQGVQFSEHRTYVDGDDVRHINWNVSARTREPMVKKYDEERELTVLLVVDTSLSTQFGTTQLLKSDLAAEVGGALAFAANATGDRVGALFFGAQVDSFIPPKKGRSHVLRLIAELLARNEPPLANLSTHTIPGTNLLEALRAAGRYMKHRGIIFVLSDFQAPDYTQALRQLAKRHDVVAVQLVDRRELEIPPMGILAVRDPESGEEALIDTRARGFQAWHQKYRQMQIEGLKTNLQGCGAESFAVETREDAGEALTHFFRNRSRRVSR